MRTIYLFSQFTTRTNPILGKFINHSGGVDACIAILLQNEDQKERVRTFTNILSSKYGQFKVSFIYPIDDDYNLSKCMHKDLKEATGILIWGGHTHTYRLTYNKDNIAKLIKAKYNNGTPYAGLSAGAILAFSLGLLTNCIFKPHFTNTHRFTELLSKIRKNQVRYGIGLDDNLAIIIKNEVDFSFHGKDTCHFFERTSDFDYKLTLFKNGDKLHRELTTQIMQ